MSVLTTTGPTIPSVVDTLSCDYSSVLAELHDALGVECCLWDSQDGSLLHASSTQPVPEELLTSAVVCEVARSNEAQFAMEDAGVALLAIPLPTGDSELVATAAFVTERAARVEELTSCFRSGSDQLAAWIESSTVCDANMVLRLGRAVAGKLKAVAESRQLDGEVDMISRNLASTYEEISLVYTVTENLSLSRTDEELGQLAIDRLMDCVPAEGVAILCLANEGDGSPTHPTRSQPVLLTTGECPVDNDGFAQLLAALDLTPTSGPFIANTRITGKEDWRFPEIRQLVIVPVTEGEQVFGWLAAFNHYNGEEFGTVEANLLNSVGALLGVHGNNRELYRQQSELLANLVHALVSAIDAKDPYTSGHSDRVARYAVRIALEMRVEAGMMNTIYMAGLLHDVGKIGIDDNVLRKAGRLTDAEFEHIKMHPEIGHKILADIKQLKDVLPAVLHHHEQWDGGGYPHGLRAEDIPTIARIMAVADAYDAMTSDRPYRNGMPEDKVDAIFREGARGYWDPDVVDAFFRCKDDIVAIRDRERRDFNLDEQHWA